MPTISIIVAIDRQRAIGFENKLLFWLPADLKRFKQLTTGNTIVMGRKTFESLPKGALPNRRNIVLSRNPKTQFENAEVYSSMNEVLAHCPEDAHIYVIGGESIYRQTIDIADELCITEIDAQAPQADAYFPEIDPKIWEEQERDAHCMDEKHAHAYDFVTYRRKKQ